MIAMSVMERPSLGGQRTDIVGSRGLGRKDGGKVGSRSDPHVRAIIWLREDGREPADIGDGHTLAPGSALSKRERERDHEERYLVLGCHKLHGKRSGSALTGLGLAYDGAI